MGEAFDEIRAVAKHQRGYFATHQVEASSQLLSYHAREGNLERVRRGIYRVADFPPAHDEEYVVAYLWTEEEGVLSHQTALAVHELSDVLPNAIHLTVPAVWRERERKIPEAYRLHYADLDDDETEWAGPVVVTTPRRTLQDVAEAGMNPERVERAIDEALRRGMVEEGIEREILRFLITRRAADD